MTLVTSEMAGQTGLGKMSPRQQGGKATASPSVPLTFFPRQYEHHPCWITHTGTDWVPFSGAINHMSNTFLLGKYSLDSGF